MGNDGGAETCPRWSSLLGEDCTPGWGEWADHGHLTQKALCTWAIARVAGRDLLGVVEGGRHPDLGPDSVVKENRQDKR